MGVKTTAAPTRHREVFAPVAPGGKPLAPERREGLIKQLRYLQGQAEMAHREAQSATDGYEAGKIRLEALRRRKGTPPEQVAELAQAVRIARQRKRSADYRLQRAEVAWVEWENYLYAMGITTDRDGKGMGNDG